MEAVLDFFRTVNTLVPAYPRWIFWGVLVGVILLTQIVKLPIKALTNKIPNDALRQKVNTVIIFIPVGLGLMASWLLTFAGYEFIYEAGIVWGLFSQVIYEFVTKVFKRIKNGEDIDNATLKGDLDEANKNAQSVTDEFQSLVKQATSKKATKK